MNFGLMLPNRGKEYGDPNALLDLFLLAENSGWGACFLWDHIGGGGGSPCVDSWLVLAAAAVRTQRLRLGTMVTPLSRRRPWKVAREVVTLDHLSGGRAILGVGLGDMVNKDFKDFSEVTGPRRRAAMLDESLEIIAGLQSGAPYEFHGKHYNVENAHFMPRPLQQPRVPVWVAARWPFKRPLLRAARWDGVAPLTWDAGPITPAVIREMAAFIAAHRSAGTPIDICKIGSTSGKDPAGERAMVQSYAEAGATWWIEAIDGSRGTIKQVQKRIAAGPPAPAP